MAVQCFADDIEESFRNDLEESEMLLRDITEQSRKPTPAEYVFFARCGWDEVRTRDQLRRMYQALNLVPVAGSPATREAAEAEAKTSSSVLESEGPKIREKLDKLQKQLDGLERDARLSAKRCEEQRDAVSKLRELVPLHVRQQVDQATTVLNTSGVGATLREAKSRHHELVCVLNHGGVYDRPEKHIEYGLRRLLPEAVRTTVEGQMIRYAYSPEWPALKTAAETEFAELNQRLPGLQAAYDQELAAIELGLDFYSNGQQND